MGHSQYLVYSSKSSILEECIIVFQVFIYKYNPFPNPSSNCKKIKMSRILLSINLHFGCSSYTKISGCRRKSRKTSSPLSHLLRFKTVTLLSVHIKYDQRGAGRHGTHLPHLRMLKQSPLTD